jgi:hypothetical protein
MIVKKSELLVVPYILPDNHLCYAVAAEVAEQYQENN